MLNRIEAFNKETFLRSRTMVAVDQTLTCKVPLQAFAVTICRGLLCIWYKALTRLWQHSCYVYRYWATKKWTSTTEMPAAFSTFNASARPAFL